ncbi:MAG TPA: methionine--tRNA ligase [Candidatus Stercoripulliclostridium merdigallinarum]|uniref:Methionine--tRNA ligase n=1 Tax=Candidatus Stercoripulliclostridium merdigallinarum TaxID=2840951 RepID=A0A9D1MHW9_9FIRM|nr:methionine--tRNA ligase [Candidatus Stercoripulliclostridium merdigallinarum]
MVAKPKYYLTTAIAYTSGTPHIGNVYEIVLTDFLARFKRLEGYDVRFQTGTDEHGQKIEEKAAAAGVTPKAFVDKVAGDIRRIWDEMDIKYDRFIRTTDEDHVAAVQALFEKLYKQGDIYKGSYKGWYCTPCESFWTESQLKDGKCPDCGREVKEAEEEAYFFRMSKYADKLLKYYEDHPDFIVPLSRKNEMINNFLKPGLQDLCVSRSSFTWGIPVTFDKKHVVYVWLDALFNYVTGLGYDGEKGGELYNKYWPADVHVIGKDIVRFHTIYWPIFLMAAGLPLPKQVFGHPWLLQDGGKMSKSKGNVIYADDLIKFFGVDAVRSYLLREMPFDNDGTISWEAVAEKTNAELANIYGNLVSRTAAMSHKYFGGVVEDGGAYEPIDDELKSAVTALAAKVKADVDAFKVADAIDEIFLVLRRANKYIDETAPWILAKDAAKADRLKTVLYNLSETIIICSTLLAPVMPKTAEKVLAMYSAPARSFDELNQFGLLKNGTSVTQTADKLFNRIDIEKMMKEVDAMYAERNGEVRHAAAAATPAKSAEQKETEEKKEETTLIGIEDFAKVQLKTGKVLASEHLPNSKKLLKNTVQIGDETRTILSGISKWYTPEEMVGKTVIVAYNLKPAKLAGVISEGMLLCAEDDGNVVLLTTEKEVKSGSDIS